MAVAPDAEHQAPGMARSSDNETDRQKTRDQPSNLGDPDHVLEVG